MTLLFLRFWSHIIYKCTIKVFIASPGDVMLQRDEIEDIIVDWNNQHTDDKNIVLLPIRWEKNAVASYKTNESGQAVINEQLVLSSDLLIALFGNKIGTRTSSGKSGTVEEINVFYEKNKMGVGIFFVDEQNVPHELIEERVWVDRYKDHLSKNNKGLYQTYTKRNIQFFINKNVQDLINSLSSDFKPIIGIDLFDDFKFDYDEQLLIIFSIEEQIISFGDRWKADTTLDRIRSWEKKNNLTSYLSDRYSIALDKLNVKGILKPVEYTSENNPRLHSFTNDFYQSFKKIIKDNPNLTKQKKSAFSKITEEDYGLGDLPF